MAHVILVTGPARSGKSEWAENLAMQAAQPVIYLATAQVDPTDVEWQARIQQHQQRRSADWTTQQVPFELAIALRSAPDQTCLLVDSLGTWLANWLDQDEAAWTAILQELMAQLATTANTVIFVSEETGWGVVPAYPLGRTFRDRLGTLTRHISAIADEVYLVTAGYALNLRLLGTPLPHISKQANG